jgi:putative ABC transport system permease protein
MPRHRFPWLAAVWLQTLHDDVRNAFRILRRAPGVFLVAIGSLGLGIGGVTTVYSALDAFLLQPPPYQDSIYYATLEFPATAAQTQVTMREFQEWERARESKLLLAAFQTRTVIVGTRSDAPMRVADVTPRFFAALGVKPEIGRNFVSDEWLDSGSNVVLISQAFARRVFGDPRSATGRTLFMDGASMTVIGVMPSDFVFPLNDVVAWLPMVLSNRNADQRSLIVIARLESARSVTREEQTLAAVQRHLQPVASDKPVEVRLLPAQDRLITSRLRQAAAIISCAAGFMLLIACVNLANLLLVRGVSRTKEFALRRAIGANRSRLTRQLLTESLVLGLLGGALGVGLALWGKQGLLACVRLMADTRPFPDVIPMNARVLFFAFVVTVVAATLFGTGPALRSHQRDLRGPLVAGGRGATPTRGERRLRTTLAALQLVLAVTLLGTAGLLVRSYFEMNRVDLGFATEMMMTARIDLQDSAQVTVPFLNGLEDRLSTIPGVQAVAIADRIPLEGPGRWRRYSVSGDATLEPLFAPVRVVSPGYLTALDIPLLKGRPITASDTRNATPIAMVNQAMVRRHWSHEDPTTARLRLGDDEYQIVGVVGDTREWGPSGPALPMIYLSGYQSPLTQLRLMLRHTRKDGAIADDLQRAVHAEAPSGRVQDVRLMLALLRQTTVRTTLMARVMGFLAVVALAMAMIGVYGVLAYGVARRTSEFGVRMALGAGRWVIMRLVLGSALRLALVAVAVGLPAAVLSGLALSRFLVEVSPFDPLVIATVLGSLVLTAVTAATIPALRAARTDPLAALRYD